MGKSYVKANKREIDGHLFDSGDEADFYEYLKTQDDVARIEVHPEFELIPSFEIDCGRCEGGRLPSPKTGNMIKCRRCEGTGRITRQPMRYTADFVVSYESDRPDEIIDIKGGWIDKQFPLRKKIFEYKNGYELIVIKKKKGKWVRS